MSESQPVPSSKKCVVCGNEIPGDRKRCPICRSSQKLKICQTCGKAIPKKARRCPCGAPQNKWGSLAFWSTAVSFLSAITLLILNASSVQSLFDRDSHTEFRVTGSDDRRIYLRIFNKGKRPSTLVGFRLIFADQPKNQMMLEVSQQDVGKAANGIAPDSYTPISLRLPLDSSIPQAERYKQYSVEDRRQMLTGSGVWNTRSLVLEMDVQESNDPPNSHETRYDRFPASRISEFMVGTLGAEK